MAGTVPREVTRERERRAWELRQKLWTQDRIAAELGITQQAIAAIFKRLDKRFLAKSDQLIAEQKASQTERLLYLAEQAMRAFERSQEDAVTVTTTTGRFKVTKDGEAIPLPDEEKVQRVGQAGCPGLLTEARNALADIRKLWGLDAPTKTDVTSGGKTIDIKEIVVQLPQEPTGE